MMLINSHWKFLKFSAGALIFILFALLWAQTAAASGWYLRGGVGYEKSRGADFSDNDCASTNPAALFGCVKGADGQPIGAYGDFGNFPLAELAAGRQLLPWLRTEIALTYRFHMDYAGNANFLAPKANPSSNQPVSARADSLSGMLNLFIDINGFFEQNKFWRFQPYLGGGMGLAHNRIGEMTFLFPDNATHKISITPSGNKTNVAFMMAVGTGITITEKIILDISYRYFDLGRVETDPGIMYMNHTAAGIAINGTESRLCSHGLAVGLRYHF